MKDGFYTALGTPLDDRGNLIEDSFRKQVSDQITEGASGLLALGTMGCQPNVKTEECPKVAKACIEEAANRCPVFVGVLDNSIARVMARIDALEGLSPDGVVLTTPYYFVATQEEIINFYRAIARGSSLPVYMYDLPVTTKTKMEVATIETLMKEENIKGIKTGVLPTARKLLQSPANKADFTILFSGIDVCDIAFPWGLSKFLDGMFAVTPKASGQLARALENGNREEARKILDRIVELRDRFFKLGVFRAFSEAMHLLGYEGDFAPDYCLPLTEDEKEYIKTCMTELGHM